MDFHKETISVYIKLGYSKGGEMQYEKLFYGKNNSTNNSNNIYQ